MDDCEFSDDYSESGEENEHNEDVDAENPSSLNFQPIISRHHAASVIQAMRSRSIIQTPGGQRPTSSASLDISTFNDLVNVKQEQCYGSPSDHSSDENPVERSKDFSIYYAPNPNAVMALNYNPREIADPWSESNGQTSKESPSRLAHDPCVAVEDVESGSDWSNSDDESGRRSIKLNAPHIAAARSFAANPKPSASLQTDKRLSLQLNLKPGGTSSQTGTLDTPLHSKEELEFYRSLLTNAPKKQMPQAAKAKQVIEPKVAWEDSSSDEEENPSGYDKKLAFGLYEKGNPIEDALEDSHGLYLSDAELGPDDLIDYSEANSKPRKTPTVSKKIKKKKHKPEAFGLYMSDDDLGPEDEIVFFTSSSRAPKPEKNGIDFTSSSRVPKPEKNGMRLEVKSAPHSLSEKSLGNAPEVGSDEWVEKQYAKRLKQARKFAKAESYKNKDDHLDTEDLFRQTNMKVVIENKTGKLKKTAPSDSKKDRSNNECLFPPLKVQSNSSVKPQARALEVKPGQRIRIRPRCRNNPL